MSLTKQQLAEAEKEYIEARLSPVEKALKTRRDAVENEMAKLRAELEQIQEDCPHPLIARDAVNEGSTGNWDRQDSYWTRHHCKLCDRRWSTGQRWQYVGGKMGHPNDQAAKEED